MLSFFLNIFPLKDNLTKKICDISSFVLYSNDNVICDVSSSVLLSGDNANKNVQNELRGVKEKKRLKFFV